MARPVEHPAKLVWQRVQRLVLRLVSFVALFCVPLVPWVDNSAQVFLLLLKSPVGLENFVSDSCFREIEVESSVFEFWSVFVLRLFSAIVSAQCVLQPSPRTSSHLLKGIFVESLDVLEGNFGTVVIWKKFWIGSHSPPPVIFLGPS